MLFSVFLNNYIDPATAADTLIIILFIFTLSTILPNVLKKLKLSSFDESKPKLNARTVKVLPTNRDVNKKRTDYIGWEEYFMAMAFLAAKRSKDPVSQVGACIVNQDKQIISVGYNGMPRGCSDDLFPWAKYADNPCDTKFMYVCHAEVNAILNKNCHDLKGCTIYVALFPCNKCAIEIIQSKIKTVVYMSDKNKDKDSTRAARAMFDACGIVYRQYKSDMTKIEIDFTDIDWNKDHQMPPTPVKKS